MTDRIEFTVHGEPRGKQRARSTRSGHHYTPRQTEVYESYIRSEFVRVAGGNPAPWDGPVVLSVEAVYGIPRSWSKKRTASALARELVPCTKKPDADNVAKVVLDALNGVAYRDDAQVFSCLVLKRYGDVARLDVAVTLVEEI